MIYLVVIHRIGPLEGGDDSKGFDIEAFDNKDKALQRAHAAREELADEVEISADWPVEFREVHLQ